MHTRLGGMLEEVGRTDTAFLLAIFLSGTALSRKCSCATFLDPRGGWPASAGLGARNTCLYRPDSGQTQVRHWGVIGTPWGDLLDRST